MSGFIVVCTNRGRHKQIVFTNVTVQADGSRQMKNTLNGNWGWPGDENGRGHSRDLYEFVCPRCRRAPQFRRDVWWAIVERALEAGVSRLDLSRMPAKLSLAPRTRPGESRT